MSTPQILEHNGVKLTINEWAKRIGVDDSTIRSRLGNGWTVAQALGSKANTVFVSKRQTPTRAATRNDAEMYLNDLAERGSESFSWVDMPGRIFRLLPRGIESKRPGTWIRTNHPAVFEEFYLKDFILRHHD